MRTLVLVLVAASMLGNTCTKEPMVDGELAKRVQEEVVPGTPRATVEEKLDSLGIEYVYAPRKALERIGQHTNGDIQLSGRFDATTQYERMGLGGLRRFAIFIDLDEEERVVEVRVQEVRTGL